jgi:hypothetical protein
MSPTRRKKRKPRQQSRPRQMKMIDDLSSPYYTALKDKHEILTYGWMRRFEQNQIPDNIVVHCLSFLEPPTQGEIRMKVKLALVKKYCQEAPEYNMCAAINVEEFIDAIREFTGTFNCTALKFTWYTESHFSMEGAYINKARYGVTTLKKNFFYNNNNNNQEIQLCGTKRFISCRNKNTNNSNNNNNKKKNKNKNKNKNSEQQRQIWIADRKIMKKKKNNLFAAAPRSRTRVVDISSVYALMDRLTWYGKNVYILLPKDKEFACRIFFGNQFNMYLPPTRWRG